MSYVQVLGYPRLSDEERRHSEAFFASATVLPIADEVLREAVRIRQRQRMLLGDALDAGTAPVHGLTLVTRNTKDFDGVIGAFSAQSSSRRRPRGYWARLADNKEANPK